MQYYSRTLFSLCGCGVKMGRVRMPPLRLRWAVGAEGRLRREGCGGRKAAIACSSSSPREKLVKTQTQSTC